MDQPLLTSSPQRASEAPILQSTMPQHTDAAFHCASYPSAPHFSIRPLQHPSQKTAIALTHIPYLSHTVSCMPLITALKLQPWRNQRASGYRTSSFSVSAVPGCFVVWAECLNAEGLGRTQISWKMGGLVGGLSADREEEGRRYREMLLFYERMTQSELVINSEWKRSAGLCE